MVLGGNRDNSADSRFWGLVPMNLARGKALLLSLNTAHPRKAPLRTPESSQAALGHEAASLGLQSNDCGRFPDSSRR
jgi:hypothetical protein